MKPYKEKIYENFVVRTFSENIDSSELKWHYDEQDRYVVPLNENDWYFQMDNNTPKKFNSPVYIPKNTYHRVIKGTTPLECKIFKEGVHKLPMNESLQRNSTISKEKLYEIHRKKNIPLNESFLRVGSDSWCDMVNMLREDYKKGQRKLTSDERFIIESRAGEYSIYKGEKVPLEVPFLFKIYENTKPIYGVFVEENRVIKRILFQ